jgi:hypothetical protein
VPTTTTLQQQKQAKLKTSEIYPKQAYRWKLLFTSA